MRRWWGATCGSSTTTSLSKARPMRASAASMRSRCPTSPWRDSTSIHISAPIRSPRATRGVDRGARLGKLVGVGRGPARHPRRGALQPAIRTVVGAAEALALERVVERRLPAVELAPHFLARLVEDERRADARALEERGSEARGDEEAHLLAVEALGDVHSDGLGVTPRARPAAHAPVGRGREVDGPVLALVDPAVLRARTHC